MDDPARARPLPGAAEVLHRLSGRFATTAVVSGRPVAFLAEHLRPGDRLRLFGVYGLEGWDPVRGRATDPYAPWRAVATEVAARADAAAPPGVVVECKGLTVTLHYRTAPAWAGWARTWARSEAQRAGLEVHPARMSEELRPPVPVDKGTVVADLVAGLGAACFVGDDIGDLPAFVALERAAATVGLAAVKVAVASTETPADLLAAADVVVDGPTEALALLERLAAPQETAE